MKCIRCGAKIKSSTDTQVKDDVHGLLNDGDTEFIYISVTAPPIHFGYAYLDKQ